MANLSKRSTFVSPLAYILLLIILASCSSPFDELRMNMVDIPSGKFFMGCVDSLADPDEAPVHEVNVRSFRLCRVEVNQRLWKAVMKRNPSYHKGDAFPVEMVSFYDVEKFISVLNRKTGRSYRLPTEIEWEYAASIGIYRADLPIDEMAWYESNSNGSSQSVGEKHPDAMGLYDMLGNVNEWVMCVYEGTNYLGSVVSPIDSLEKEIVFRGGAFNSPKQYCRIHNRNHVRADMRNYAIGLRLAE